MARCSRVETSRDDRHSFGLGQLIHDQVRSYSDPRFGNPKARQRRAKVLKKKCHVVDICEDLPCFDSGDYANMDYSHVVLLSTAPLSPEKVKEYVSGDLVPGVARIRFTTSRLTMAVVEG